MAKKIIYFGIGFLFIVTGLLIFFNFQNSTYISQDRHFSFKYPNKWKPEVTNLYDHMQINFKDEESINILAVYYPYYNPKFETHVINESREIEIENYDFILNYSYLKSSEKDFPDYVILRWKKGCFNIKDESCFESKGDGGVMIINLGNDVDSQQDNLKIADKIISSFKIINE